MKTRTVTVSQAVASVLGDSEVVGNLLKLPGTLDRKLYVDVNKIIELLGGKWNKSQKGHVFPESPAAAIDEALLTGQVTDTKKTFQFFPTPLPLAQRMVKMAGIKKGMEVLEPSAGAGNIAGLLRAAAPNVRVTMVELDESKREKLINMGQHLHIGSFMEFETDKQFDCIVANPPFSNQQDIDHVNRMIDLLKPGGTLVTVMSPSFTFRDNKKAVDFRARLDELDHEVEELPAGTFEESGTNIRAVLVTVSKAA